MKNTAIKFTTKRFSKLEWTSSSKKEAMDSANFFLKMQPAEKKRRMLRCFKEELAYGDEISIFSFLRCNIGFHASVQNQLGAEYSLLKTFINQVPAHQIAAAYYNRKTLEIVQQFEDLASGNYELINIAIRSQYQDKTNNSNAVRIVEELVEKHGATPGIKWNNWTYDATTPLILSIEHRKYEVTQYLLKQNVGVLTKDNLGKDPLKELEFKAPYGPESGGKAFRMLQEMVKIQSADQITR